MQVKWWVVKGEKQKPDEEVRGTRGEDWLVRAERGDDLHLITRRQPGQADENGAHSAAM